MHKTPYLCNQTLFLIILSCFSTFAQSILSLPSTLTADSHSMPCPCLSPAMPCRNGFRIRLSHLTYTVRPCLIHTYHAMPMPCSDHVARLKATAQHARRETACVLSVRVRLLPATTRSSTTFVIRRIPISDVGGQCETKQHLSWTRKRVVAAHYKKRRSVKTVRIFPATTRNFTKDTTLSEHCRGAAWLV